MTDYLLDTNVLIKAKNRYHGFDFCLAFWDWLVEKNHAGKVASIKEVAEELNKGEDDPTDWAEARGDDFFLKPDDAVVSKLRTVSDWVSVNGYQPGTVATFLQVADCWLFTHALAHNCTVVMHEVRADSKCL